MQEIVLKELFQLNKTTQGIKHTDCKIIQRSDGYGYNLKDIEIAKEV